MLAVADELAQLEAEHAASVQRRVQLREAAAEEEARASRLATRIAMLKRAIDDRT